MPSYQTRKTSDGGKRIRATVSLTGADRITRTFDTKAEAKQWAEAEERRIRLDRAGGPQPLGIPVADVFAHYRANRLHELKDPEHREYGLRFWELELEGKSIAGVTPKDIAEVKMRLKKKYSPGTVNRYLAALSAVYTYAQKEMHVVGDNPVKRVTKLPEPKGRTRFLSREELERLLEATRTSTSADLHLAVLISLTTGARRGEVLGLRWGQVNFEAGTLELKDGETKNGEARVLPMVASVRDLLIERKRGPRTDSEAWVLKHGDVRSSWRSALRKAKIEDFHWHDLRHTAASYLMMAGVSPLEISKILGHKTMAMVSRYAHLAPGRVGEIGNTLAGAMGV